MKALHHKKWSHMDTETFINRCRFVHGNQYEYKYVRYVNPRTKIKLICKRCGLSWLTNPYAHLTGCGCPRCLYKRLPQNQTRSNAWFLEKVKQVHPSGFRYLTPFRGSWKKMHIKCLCCGKIFWQKASSHLEGTGCPHCSVERNKKINPPRAYNIS